MIHQLRVTHQRHVQYCSYTNDAGGRAGHALDICTDRRNVMCKSFCKVIAGVDDGCGKVSWTEMRAASNEWSIDLNG